MARWPYNSREWREARDEVLRGSPRCQITPGCPRRATVVDHHPVPVADLVAGRAPRWLAFFRGNLRPGCKPCNDREGGRISGRNRGVLRVRSRVW